MLDFIHQPTGKIRLGDYLQSHLRQNEWTHFRAAIAFVKYSGTRHIREALTSFSHHSHVKISVGIDSGGTSMEGLRDLLESLEGRGEIWVYHNENNSTFHPKIYLFKNDIRADLLVGSGNLTEGGLYTNYEASLAVSLDLNLQEDRNLLKLIEDTLDVWSHLAPGTSRLLTLELLDQLVTNQDVPIEAQARETEEVAANFRQAAVRAARLPLFARIAVPRAPRPPKEVPGKSEEEYLTEEDFDVEASTPLPWQAGKFRGFVMMLQQMDVGVGQITPGKSRRSPEIFIPLTARDYDPDFWGWPQSFIEDRLKPEKMDRRGVKMRIGTRIVDVNMMTWPDKSDFRLRSEFLRSAGNVGDILRIEKSDRQSGFDYYVEIIPQNTLLHAQFLALCMHSVRNSKKRWGYY